ncbi:MAG TPA: hypothetical protein VKV17_13380 [Bryobacteraceae bacterium]|nr:hypothetical protein [Bryobacteraceae bacterium]
MGRRGRGGPRIWWFLRSRLARPVALFRTTAAWIESETLRGGKRLSAQEVEALRRLKSQVSAVRGEDAGSARDLMDRLMEHRVRIEQERY